MYKHVKTDCESGCVFIHSSSKRAKEILKTAEVINEISVLNIGSHELDGFTWKVIGNAPVNIKKSQVPKMHRGEHGVGSHSYSGGVLSVLAEAYYGLEPWNASLSNDELLMPNINRPKEEFFLSGNKSYCYSNE